MTTAMRITATKKVPMDLLRKTALIAGVFYLVTFISIPTLALYGRTQTSLTRGPRLTGSPAPCGHRS
jgi:hypothetical protein